MKIFISWSGHTSHEVACALKDWLPTVLPFADPWVSSEDIDKGARWSQEIAVELGNSNFGVICVVPGNIDQPWLNFEAGAISKSLEAGKVAPFLVGVRQDQITGPLAQFQLTVFERDDVLKLVKSMNRASLDAISDDRLSKNFDNCWNSLVTAIGGIDIVGNVQDTEPQNEQAGELKETEIRILKELARFPARKLPMSVVANLLKLSGAKAEFYLQQMSENRYLKTKLFTGGKEIEYYLAQKGREYLVRNDLV